MGPNLDLTQRRATEGENLKREDDPFKEKVIVAAATQNHHSVRTVAVGTFLQHPIRSLRGWVCIKTVQRKKEATSILYSQLSGYAIGVDDNTFRLLMFSAQSIS